MQIGPPRTHVPQVPGEVKYLFRVKDGVGLLFPCAYPMPSGTETGRNFREPARGSYKVIIQRDPLVNSHDLDSHNEP